jgi:hypothetical protein
MSRYRKIDPRIWNDEKFRELSDKAKLVFLMLLTHPNMTAIGAMRGTVAGLAEELAWDLEAFRIAFRDVLAKGMAEHDQKACLIALPRFVKYNRPESPNVVVAWSGALDLLPECALKNHVVARAAAFARGMNKGFAEALPEAFAKTMPIQEQEQEQKQEPNKEAPSGAVVSAAAETDLVGGQIGEPGKNKGAPAPACPVGAIVNAYHDLMPLNPKVRVLDDVRKKVIRARWREAAAMTIKPFGYQTEPQGVAAWRKFFEVCADSMFLTGRAKAAEGKPPFLADIDFLLSPSGFKKCLENKYHREAS